MKKKFNVITILALLGLIVASSITLGKVFAYFGSKSSASGAIEMGTLSIGGVTKGDGASIDWDIPNLQPNQSFGGSYKVEVNSNINYYIRILFKASVTPQSGSTHINGTGCEDYVTDDTDILSISIDGATTNTYQKSSVKTADGYTPYYRLSPTKVTSNTTTETFNIDLKINDWVGCNYCHYYMKADVVVNMRVQVMQADYLESSSEGGTVSTVDEMHDLWVAGGLETKIDDISDYPDLTFTVLSADDKTMSVKKANTSITEANIPAMVKKDGAVYNVTNIAGGAMLWYGGFRGCTNLTSVIIPDTVTSIGNYAFYDCKSLTSIDIPSRVTSIGDKAFCNCSSLTSISIPDSVTNVGADAFNSYSKNLQYNTYDNAKYLGNSTNPYVVLVSATSTSITSCTINPNCKIIYCYAFYNCSSLTSIDIPSRVTSIGDKAFCNCSSLTSISIPDSVTNVGADAFNSYSKNLQYNTYDNAKYLGNSTNPYVVLVSATSTSITSCTINPNCKIIYCYAFYNCSSLTSIDIPSSIKSIGGMAFCDCLSLTSITIPKSVTSIGDAAFYNCSKLTSIDIPNGVTSIGSYAFEYCSNLSSISIPTSVTYIGTHAFATNEREAYSSISITYAGTVAEMRNMHEEMYGSGGEDVCYQITCSDGTYTHYQYLQCIWIETEIWCWDDKKKRRYKKKLKDLTYDDDILVWDFDNGCFATAKALFITETKKATAYTLTTFSDGTTLKTIGPDDSKRHRLFNVETGRFEYIGNKMKIGTKTFNADGKIVEVVDMKFIREEIEYQNVITEYHFNLFANGILTSNRMSNLYPIKDMKYVKDNRKLSTREDFPEIEERYFNGLRLAEQTNQSQEILSDERFQDLTNYVQNLKNLSKER